MANDRVQRISPVVLIDSDAGAIEDVAGSRHRVTIGFTMSSARVKQPRAREGHFIAKTSGLKVQLGA